MKTAAFNSIVAQVDTFSYDQCLALLGKKNDFYGRQK